MLTFKANADAAILAASIAGTAGVTYVATRMSVEVSCPGFSCCGFTANSAGFTFWSRASTGSGKEMVTRHRFILIGLCVVSVTLVIAAPAHAQSAAVLDDIVTQFQSRAAGWEGALRSFALNTFDILAAIELAWAAFRLAFRGADVSEWLAEIVNQIFFLGFFLALLENSVTWGQAIVNSFRQAASTAGGTGLAPSGVFTAGVDLAQKVMSQMSIWSPAASVGLIIAGLVIEVCFAPIRRVHGAGPGRKLPCYLNGCSVYGVRRDSMDKGFRDQQVRYTWSVGAKLFVLQLLVSIGDGLIQSWVATFNDITASSLCILVGCSIVMLALVKVLPETDAAHCQWLHHDDRLRTGRRRNGRRRYHGGLRGWSGGERCNGRQRAAVGLRSDECEGRRGHGTRIAHRARCSPHRIHGEEYACSAVC